MGSLLLVLMERSTKTVLTSFVMSGLPNRIMVLLILPVLRMDVIIYLITVASIPIAAHGHTLAVTMMTYILLLTRMKMLVVLVVMIEYVFL